MRVLAVGAHPFDIELGCGGALLAHRDRGDEIHLLVMTGDRPVPMESSSPKSEQLLSAARLRATLHWGGFEAGSIPSNRDAVAVVESVLIATGSDVVYGPARDDTHQDHRATADATVSASRAIQQVLAYESPTTTNFVPRVFVDLGGRVGAKLDLISVFRSKLERNDLVDLSTIAAQARFRGSHARTSHAEGFEPIRFVWTYPTPPVDTELDAPFGARSILARSGETGRPDWLPDVVDRGPNAI